MPTTVIRFDDYELVPWKNGLGMTREVANARRADGAMLWRISLATVDRDGPFSDFTGYKRIIMMLSGDGMTLDFGSHGKAVMDRPFVPVLFDGAWPTAATLHGGPTRDLNVVTAHDGAGSAVEVLTLPAAGLELAPGKGLCLIHVLSGRVQAKTQGNNPVLETGDTLRHDGTGAIGTLSPAGGEALVYRIDIDLA